MAPRADDACPGIPAWAPGDGFLAIHVQQQRNVDELRVGPGEPGIEMRKAERGCSVAHRRTGAAPASCAGGSRPHRLICRVNEIWEPLRQSNSEEVLMSSEFEHGEEATRHERAISALTHRTGAPLAEVRTLFAAEVARLERGATVRSYLITRATSNVLATLRGTRR